MTEVRCDCAVAGQREAGRERARCVIGRAASTGPARDRRAITQLHDPASMNISGMRRLVETPSRERHVVSPTRPPHLPVRLILYNNYRLIKICYLTLINWLCTRAGGGVENAPHELTHRCAKTVRVLLPLQLYAPVQFSGLNI